MFSPVIWGEDESGRHREISYQNYENIRMNSHIISHKIENKNEQYGEIKKMHFLLNLKFIKYYFTFHNRIG